MTLEELRSRAFFQNSIDVWIMYCNEQGLDWYNTELYQKFIRHLFENNVRMQKFPLCIKESGGVYERGRDKAKFLEDLSKFSGDESSAFTLKLSSDVIAVIRGFNQGLKK